MLLSIVFINWNLHIYRKQVLSWCGLVRMQVFLCPLQAHMNLIGLLSIQTRVQLVSTTIPPSQTVDQSDLKLMILNAFACLPCLKPMVSTSYPQVMKTVLIILYLQDSPRRILMEWKLTLTELAVWHLFKQTEQHILLSFFLEGPPLACWMLSHITLRWKGNCF